MKCQICKKEQQEKYFYEGFNKCRDCIKDYLNVLTTADAYQSAKILLKESNYIENEKLLFDVFFECNSEWRDLDNISKFSTYLKMVNSLPQYKEYGCNQKVINEEKSDIDFINDDILMVKRNMKKATFQNDANAHGKWMNSLRDAFLLRERLESTIKPTYDLYFDVGRAESETNCTIYYKGQVHSLRKLNSNYISEYINKLCKDDNVAIYGDINGLGRVIADSLYSLGYKINNTTLNFVDSSINGGIPRQLECKYDR